MLNIISEGRRTKDNYKDEINHIVLEGLLKHGEYYYLLIDLCLPSLEQQSTVDLKELIKIDNNDYLYPEGNDLTILNKISLGILNGIEYINSKNIVHRDIAARNILICKGVAKVSDLGIAYKVPPDKCKVCQEYDKQILEKVPHSTTNPIYFDDESKVYGKIHYINKLKFKTISSSFFCFDLWSYGILILHLFTKYFHTIILKK